MRTLRFIVDGQTIKISPKCDPNGLVPGTEGYLQAEFSFSKEWDGYVKVAAFFSNLGTEYTPQLIGKNMTCKIPNEALQRRVFKVQVIGKKNDVKICTNKLAIYQKGGNA